MCDHKNYRNGNEMLLCFADSVEPSRRRSTRIQWCVRIDDSNMDQIIESSESMQWTRNHRRIHVTIVSHTIEIIKSSVRSKYLWNNSRSTKKIYVEHANANGENRPSRSRRITLNIWTQPYVIWSNKSSKNIKQSNKFPISVATVTGPRSAWFNLHIDPALLPIRITQNVWGSFHFDADILIVIVCLPFVGNIFNKLMCKFRWETN